MTRLLSVLQVPPETPLATFAAWVDETAPHGDTYDRAVVASALAPGVIYTLHLRPLPHTVPDGQYRFRQSRDGVFLTRFDTLWYARPSQPPCWHAAAAFHKTWAQVGRIEATVGAPVSIDEVCTHLADELSAHFDQMFHTLPCVTTFALTPSPDPAS